jgi:hypothetical protein
MITLAPAQAVSRGLVLLACLGASEVLISLQGVSNNSPLSIWALTQKLDHRDRLLHPLRPRMIYTYPNLVSKQ